MGFYIAVLKIDVEEKKKLQCNSHSYGQIEDMIYFFCNQQTRLL